MAILKKIEKVSPGEYLNKYNLKYETSDGKPPHLGGIGPSSPGEAGLRGGSGRVVRAAAPEGKTKTSPPFLRRKDREDRQTELCPTCISSKKFPIRRPTQRRYILKRRLLWIVTFARGSIP